MTSFFKKNKHKLIINYFTYLNNLSWFYFNVPCTRIPILRISVKVVGKRNTIENNFFPR